MCSMRIKRNIALQYFVGDFAKLLISAQIAAMQFTKVNSRIHRCPQSSVWVF